MVVGQRLGITTVHSHAHVYVDIYINIVILLVNGAGGCGPVLQQRMLLLWGKQVPETILTHGWILDIAQEDISWTKVYIHVHTSLV